MSKMLFFIFVIYSAFAQASDSRSDRLKTLLSDFQHLTTISSRLEAYSKIFLGLPYGKGGPLGEGKNGPYDQDPLYRFDTFDCTTYVETIISLALSSSSDEFELQINAIRYENGEIDYLKRNHFPSLQWIPNNIKNGLLRESNTKITFAHQFKKATALIDYGNWLKSHKIENIRVPLASNEEKENLLDELKRISDEFSPQLASLDYIPISLFLSTPSLLSQIPNGSIINFIRPNWDLSAEIGTPMNVSHQGFIFQRDKQTFLRHASTTGFVTEVLLKEYLEKFRNHSTLKGLHFMELQ